MFAYPAAQFFRRTRNLKKKIMAFFGFIGVISAPNAVNRAVGKYAIASAAASRDLAERCPRTDTTFRLRDRRGCVRFSYAITMLQYLSKCCCNVLSLCSYAFTVSGPQKAVQKSTALYGVLSSRNDGNNCISFSYDFFCYECLLSDRRSFSTRSDVAFLQFSMRITSDLLLLPDDGF